MTIMRLIAIKYFNQLIIYSRGGTVHRCHGSVRTSVRGSRLDMILLQQEQKINLLCSVNFHLFWNRQ